MNKNNQDNQLLNSDFASNKEVEINKVKTTNVNILLNRVRLDQKRTLKKKIIFSTILACLVSLLAVYFIIWSKIWFKKFIETIKIYIINHLKIKAG